MICSRERTQEFEVSRKNKAIVFEKSWLPKIILEMSPLATSKLKKPGGWWANQSTVGSAPRDRLRRQRNLDGWCNQQPD
jgi:hypothetical protein